MNRRPLKRTLLGYHVRAATPADLAACNALCFDVHGFERGDELNEAVEQGTATVVERDGQITGYATDESFFARSVAKSKCGPDCADRRRTWIQRARIPAADPQLRGIHVVPRQQIATPVPDDLHDQGSIQRVGRLLYRVRLVLIQQQATGDQGICAVGWQHSKHEPRRRR